VCRHFLQYEALKFGFSRVVKPTFHPYLGSCYHIICILAVYKCDLSIHGNWTDYWRKLEGLLKETGRSIDGNWTVCWRKLFDLLKETGWSIDGNWKIYWRKLDGLLTETGPSIDGNWTVNWRKLDGLLTEAGWSIDGNWTVCWWKQFVSRLLSRLFLSSLM